MYLVVSGNIGTGKTTLVRQLQSRIGVCVAAEEQRSVFLKRYLADKRFAFANQLDYTLQFVELAAWASSQSVPVIQERSFEETHAVFSGILHDEGVIDDEMYSLLKRCVDIGRKWRAPSHIVILEAQVDELFKRIHRRADPQERGITKEYVERLAERYESWSASLADARVLRIATDDMTPTAIADAVVSWIG
ncbi:MAG: deoxynucleoside kinase [Fimbriimonadaceae bacterium]|nr:deoxynucleoside kinase [Fimbriimonadaceae bacterium]